MLKYLKPNEYLSSINKNCQSKHHDFIKMHGAKYSRMDQINLWKPAFKKFERVMVCFRPTILLQIF